MFFVGFLCKYISYYLIAAMLVGFYKIFFACEHLILTKLSSRLATIDANRLSPASSEIRNIYSGALTWFDRCDRPVRGILRVLVSMFLMRQYIMRASLYCNTNKLGAALERTGYKCKGRF